ncbi:MAG: flagellar export protein FliJ [Phycisphaeraceae bacterium]
MAQFQFKYESVLRHCQRVEDERQRQLAQRLRTQMILRNQLGEMQDTISRSKRELGDGLVGHVDLGRISGFARYSGQAAQRAREIAHRLGSLEEQISAARGELLEATRQRKALELLRDKHEAAWRKQRQRREAIDLDELATQRYIRQLSMEGAA